VDDTSPDNKLFPFKYKTAEQPLMTSSGKLIAVDTSVYFATANPEAAIRAGLANMGYSENEAYSWVKTDTFQLLTHQVSPATQALSCTECHGSTSRMDLKAELGYGLKGAEATVCSQCHGVKANPGFTSVHRKHITDEQLGCQNCHSFSRPERNLK
jgi:cytochrome c553